MQHTAFRPMHLANSWLHVQSSLGCRVYTAPLSVGRGALLLPRFQRAGPNRWPVHFARLRVHLCCLWKRTMLCLQSIFSQSACAVRLERSGSLAAQAAFLVSSVWLCVFGFAGRPATLVCKRVLRMSIHHRVYLVRSLCQIMSIRRDWTILRPCG